MSGKGSGYERELCKRLSLWWTQDEDPPRQDVFWRSTASGARATSRGKQGLKTCNSSGDVCALDPCGQPLIDLITIEVKRGYSRCSIQDLLDKGPKAAKQTYQKWIETAIRDHQRAGSFSWMLVVRRDQRQPLVILPNELKDLLWEYNGESETDHSPFAEVEVWIDGVGMDGWVVLTLMPLETWSEVVDPKDVRQALKEWKRKEVKR